MSLVQPRVLPGSQRHRNQCWPISIADKSQTLVGVSGFMTSGKGTEASIVQFIEVTSCNSHVTNTLNEYLTTILFYPWIAESEEKKRFSMWRRPQANEVWWNNVGEVWIICFCVCDCLQWVTVCVSLSAEWKHSAVQPDFTDQGVVQWHQITRSI